MVLFSLLREAMFASVEISVALEVGGAFGAAHSPSLYQRSGLVTLGKGPLNDPECQS